MEVTNLMENVVVNSEKFYRLSLFTDLFIKTSGLIILHQPFSPTNQNFCDQITKLTHCCKTSQHSSCWVI